jgi:hypothetical protein
MMMNIRIIIPRNNHANSTKKKSRITKRKSRGQLLIKRAAE